LPLTAAIADATPSKELIAAVASTSPTIQTFYHSRIIVLSSMNTIIVHTMPEIVNGRRRYRQVFTPLHILRYTPAESLSIQTTEL
jgi:hypothetical protein